MWGAAAAEASSALWYVWGLLMPSPLISHCGPTLRVQYRSNSPPTEIIPGRRRPVARGARVLAARRVDGLDGGGLLPVLHRHHFLAGAAGPTKAADHLGQSNDDELVERKPGAAGSACRLVSKQGSPRLARAALCMLFLCVSLCQAFHVLESTLRAVVFQHCVIAHS